ncbi:hypothetical protein BSKO_09248 [Bryopsis sp. KO-2023]|nr:hypothetical protein BSKO_09248 [Bryopsis sp. KO-2023]
MGRKTYTYDVNTRGIPQGFRDSQRQLGDELGGVIFGCTNDTFEECVKGRIFGLPRAHLLYVQEIVPGLPLFLYNYSVRKLHGVYRAVSPGLPEINPHGWTGGNTAPTHFPAQVRVELCKRCDPLTENQFKPVLAKNYQDEKHFVFELDKKQVAGLCKLFNCQVPRGPPKEKWNGIKGLTVGVSGGAVGGGGTSSSAIPRNANSLGGPGPSQSARQPNAPANWKTPARKSEGTVLNMDEFPALGGGPTPAAGAAAKETIIVKRVVLNNGGGDASKGKPTVAANRRVSEKGRMEAKEGGSGKKIKEIVVSATSEKKKEGKAGGQSSQVLGSGKAKQRDPVIEVSFSRPGLEADGGSSGAPDWQVVNSNRGKKEKTKIQGGAAGGSGKSAGKGGKGGGGCAKSVTSSEKSVTTGQLVTPQRVESGIPKQAKMKGEHGRMGQGNSELEDEVWKVVGKSKRRGGGGGDEGGGKKKSEKNEKEQTGKKPQSKEFLKLETGVQGQVSRDSWEGHINQLERLRQPERAMPPPQPLGESLDAGLGRGGNSMNLANVGRSPQQNSRKSIGSGVSVPKNESPRAAQGQQQVQGPPLPIPRRRETILACESEISSPRHSEMSMMVTVERRGAAGAGNPRMSGMGVPAAAMHASRPRSDGMSDVEMASARGGTSRSQLPIESLCGLSVFEEDEEMMDAMETCTEIDVQVHQPEQAVNARQGSNPGGDIGVQGGGAQSGVGFSGGEDVRSARSSGGNMPKEDVSNLGVLGVLLSTANRRPPTQDQAMQSNVPQPSNEGFSKTSMSSASETYESPAPQSVPRITEALYVIGGLDERNYVPTVETYDPGSCRWTPRALLPSGKFVCGDITSLREFIFLVGGNPEVNTGHVYNTLTGSWGLMAPLSNAEANLGVGCTTCDGRVYAVGGGAPKNELSTVEVYDPNTDRWFNAPKMSHRRFAVGVASEFSVIYACGGYDGERYLESVEMLDTREGKWHMLPDMNSPRSSMACVIYDDCLWAIGGDSVDNTMDAVEVFDRQTGSWHKMAAVNETRGYCTAEVVDGELYVIGGRKSRAGFSLAGMERYNKSRSFWERGYGAGESGSRCFHSSCVIRC